MGKNAKFILLHRIISTDLGVVMPESGRSLTHHDAIELIEKWIDNMDT